MFLDSLEPRCPASASGGVPIAKVISMDDDSDTDTDRG